MRNVLAGLLILLSIPSAAIDKPPSAPMPEPDEFELWLIHRAETLDLRPTDVNVITLHMQEKPLKQKLLVLSDVVSRDDFILVKYVNLVEENQKKYGRINPFDRQLLGIMKRLDVPAKQYRIDRFNKLTDRLGIESAPTDKGAVWADALTNCSTNTRRYNADSGLWENFDDAKKEWVPEESKSKPAPR